MPEVSIIVPVYKVESYLGKCVDSVLAQTYGNFECILVEDGSPDNCGKMCDEYAAEDVRIKVIHKKNGGLSAARNAGMDIASGKWIMFVDSDDWMEPDLLEKALSAAEKHDADIVQWNYIFEGWKISDKRDNFPEGVLEIKSDTDVSWGLPLVWRRLYKSELINKYKIRFYEDLKYYEDNPFTFVMLALSKKIWCMDHVLYHYRFRKDSLVHTVSRKRIMNKILSVKKMEEDLIALGKDEQFKTIILQKKSGARNSLLLDLEKPEIKLWKETFSEINSEIGKLGWKNKILYFFILNHLEFPAEILIKIQRKRLGL